LELRPAQKTWTRIRPLFKREFAATSNDKLIIDRLANLAHRPGENPRQFFSRLEKLFNVLHENYASYFVKPERPAQLTAGNYSEDALTQAINDNVKSYNKFLLAQVFWAAAPENFCKLLSHKDQTRLTVSNAYQTFFTEHRVEVDKKSTLVHNSQCHRHRSRPLGARPGCGCVQTTTTENAATLSTARIQLSRKSIKGVIQQQQLNQLQQRQNNNTAARFKHFRKW
jgi:hypothetical protein